MNMKYLSIIIGMLFVNIGNLQAQEPSKFGILYKAPQCGCCEGYADYLRENGYKITIKPTHNLTTISREAGVPDTIQGCHTMLIDGYAVSGHVPVSIVDQLLAKRPAIKGITLPGMPMGSPGMGGTKSGPFTIYEAIDGELKVFAVD